MPTSKKRPYVTVNMAMSLDGRISTRRRELITLGSDHDRRLMDVLRAKSDAVIVGAGTIRHDGFPVLVRHADVRKKRIAKGLPPHPVNVVLSRSLDLPSSRSFFARPDTEKIVFTTRKAPPARVERFKRLAEVVVLPRQTIKASAVLHTLYDRGIKTVLLEGGGEIHYAFAKEHMVDEIYVTVTPRLIGGVGAPSILDGKGFLKDDHLKLKLVSCKRIEDELYLRYKVAC